MKGFLLVFLALVPVLSGQIVPLSGTYLGDFQRNFYGDQAPSRLRVKWKTYLGSGKTDLGRMGIKTWRGAGWTGQPLVISENGGIFLIQGTLSHHLKKIRARDGKVVWSTSLGDVIKGTPTFVDCKKGTPEERYVLVTGSREGFGSGYLRGPARSLHGVSYLTGKILWQHESRRTQSNSRDVDGSAVVFGPDKVGVPLENGFFTILSPRASGTKSGNGMPTPKIRKQFRLFEDADLQVYRGELATESSPTLYRGKAYIAAGPGRLYRIGLGMFGGKGWKLSIGGDLNGSMPVTNDGHLLVGIEKQFIPGQGGVMKVKPGGKPVWFSPTPDRKFFGWQGGLVGSPSVNHRYRSPVSSDLACHVGVEGQLTLINHKKLQPGVEVWNPLRTKKLPRPLVLDQVQLPTGSISTPLFVGDKILVGYDNGLDLYQVTPQQKLQRLDRLAGPMFDATPVVWGGLVYAASKNGYLYCLGQ